MKHEKKVWVLFVILCSFMSTFSIYSETTTKTIKPKVADKEVTDKDLEDLNEGEEVTLLPTEIVLPKDAKLILNMPVFGEVVLKATKSQKGGYIFVAEVPSADRPIDLGILKIEKGIYRLGDGKLSYSAFINFFGKRATVGLKDISLKKEDVAVLSKSLLSKEKPKDGHKIEVLSFTLGVKFLDKAASIELIPGKPIGLKDIDLTVTHRKGVEFRLIGEVLGQKVDFVAAIDAKTKKFNLRGEITKRTLTAVIPEFKGGPLEGLSIEGFVEFNIEDGLVLKGELSGAGKGQAEILGIKLKKSNIDINLKKRRAVVSGETEILGLPLKGYFGVFFGEQKGVRFTAEIPSGVVDWKPFKDVPVNVPELKEIMLRELKVGVEAQYLSATKGDKDKAKDKKEDEKKTEEKKPAVSKKKTEKPKDTKKDDDTDKKKEEETTFEEVFEGKEHTVIGDKGLKFSIFISGKSRILNTDSEVVVKLDKTKGKGFGATLIAALPQGWKLSQSFPEIFKPKKPLICKMLKECADVCTRDAGECVHIAGNYMMHAFDLLKLDKARFVLSTRKDTIDDQSVDPGFNLMAKLSIDDTGGNPFLELLKDVIVKISANKETPTLEFAGSFNPASPKTMAFKMGASAGGLGFKLGPAQLYGGSVNVVLRGEPSLGLEGLFKFKPEEDAKPITLAASAAFTPIKFNLAASMLDTWVDPFGIKGFEFGNLGFKVSQTYEVAAALIAAIFTGGTTAIDMFIPGDVGLSGDVRFGAKEGEGRGFAASTRINLGKDVSSLAIVADIRDPLSITLLLEVILKQLGAKVDILNEIGKIVPIQLKKAGFKFVPLGTSIGNIKVEPGFGGYMYLDLFGKEAHADFDISLSGFKAKGTIPKIEIGLLKMTSYDGKSGPVLDIQLNEKEQKFYIDGLLQIGDLLKSKTIWYLTKDGTRFDTETFFGPDDAKFGLKLHATTVPFTDPKQWAELKPEELKLEIKFNNKLSERIRENISAELESSKKQIEADANQAIEQIGRATVKKDLDEQEKRVQEAGKRRVDFWKDPILSMKREIEFRKEEAKSTLLKLKYGFESSGFGKFIGNAARSIGLHKVGQVFIGAFKKVGVGVVEGGQIVFNDLSKLVIIRRVYWKGSLADIGKGVIPGIELELCAGCQLIKRKLPEFDVVHPLKSVDTIVQESVKVIRDVIIATLRGDKCESLCAEVRPLTDEEKTAVAATQKQILAMA